MSRTADFNNQAGGSSSLNPNVNTVVVDIGWALPEVIRRASRRVTVMDP
jgi:hypothetical protein